MRLWIVLFIVLLTSACSAGVEDSASAVSSDAAAEVAPTAVATDQGPATTPSVFTDDFGEWFVPAPGSGSEPDRRFDASGSADEIVARINAAVPAAYDLSFEWREMSLTEDHLATALASVQWEQDDDDDYEFDSSEVGFFTEYELDTGCQGFCSPQDWQLLMNDPANSPFLIGVGQAREILVDQVLTRPAGRLIVMTGSSIPGRRGTTYVELVRWSDQADRFLKCTASVDEQDQLLWPTFADVCIAATGNWLN